MSTFFEDIKDYVGFTEADTEALRRLLPAVEPDLPAIADRFYERILAHPGTRRLITGGDEQIERQKRTLMEWLTSGLTGPHDESFFQRRAGIGRAHVRIGLPQHYMFTAMNGVRRDLRAIVERTCAADPDARRATGDAVDRLLDLELAIMLHTYREDADARLRRHERLAAVGQIAASIAHDLRQPLAVIETSLHLLRRRADPGDERVIRHLDRITAQLRAAGGIITDLLEMTRDEPPKREPVRIADVVDEAISAARLPESITLVRDFGPDLTLHAEPRLIVRALVNLLQNAAAALVDRPGTIEITATRTDDTLTLAITDDGPGFDPDILSRAFEPLVTTRSAGTGLGLPLVRRICQRHGGHAEASNAPHRGARITLHLPTTPHP